MQHHNLCVSMKRWKEVSWDRILLRVVSPCRKVVITRPCFSNLPAPVPQSCNYKALFLQLTGTRAAKL